MESPVEFVNVLKAVSKNNTYPEEIKAVLKIISQKVYSMININLIGCPSEYNQVYCNMLMQFSKLIAMYVVIDNCYEIKFNRVKLTGFEIIDDAHIRLVYITTTRDKCAVIALKYVMLNLKMFKIKHNYYINYIPSEIILESFNEKTDKLNYTDIIIDSPITFAKRYELLKQQETNYYQDEFKHGKYDEDTMKRYISRIDISRKFKYMSSKEIKSDLTKYTSVEIKFIKSLTDRYTYMHRCTCSECTLCNKQHCHKLYRCYSCGEKFCSKCLFINGACPFCQDTPLTVYECITKPLHIKSVKYYRKVNIRK